jgi:hypothetical protein
LPVENRWRIFAQSSKLITFHNGRWPCFQLAFLALFSVGVNSRPPLGADLLGGSEHTVFHTQRHDGNPFKNIRSSRSGRSSRNSNTSRTIRLGKHRRPPGLHLLGAPGPPPPSRASAVRWVQPPRSWFSEWSRVDAAALCG